MAPAVAASPAHSWNRLDGIDLLRGLAIFFVLMNHVNMRLLAAKVPYTKGLPQQLVHSLVWNGESGVQIFFAISGFLITSTALRRWGEPTRVGVRDFYVLRFARIAPLLLALLAILSVLHAMHVQNFVVSAKTGGLGQTVFAALTLHVNFLEAQRGYLPGSWDILWSLSVEEMFYLFFPLACRMLSRGKLFAAALCAFVCVGPFARTIFAHGNPVWQEYSYLGGMDAIALGCLTALFLARRHLGRWVLWTMGSMGGALMIFILCFSIRAGQWGLGRTGLSMSILAIGTCMVIAVFAQTQWRSPRLLAPLRSLGQFSYEVYLTHMFVVFGLFAVFVELGKPMKAVPVLFGVVIVISGLLGQVAARFYSEPMNRRLRNRFGDGPDRLGTAIRGTVRKPLA